MTKKQYPAASLQNISNNFSLYWGKPNSQHCVGDNLRRGKKSFNLPSPHINVNTGG
jgi:hypothetical protein